MMSPSTTDTVTRVRLVYLARLREAFASPGEALDLPAGVADVADLLALLRARGGAWQAELAPGRAVRVAVNHDVATLHTPLAGGDEIALFPPVTGG
jgi:molybdopterin synthase sulfur carrier subunit